MFSGVAGSASLSPLGTGDSWHRHQMSMTLNDLPNNSHRKHVTVWNGLQATFGLGLFKYSNSPEEAAPVPRET